MVQEKDWSAEIENGSLWRDVTRHQRLPKASLRGNGGASPVHPCADNDTAFEEGDLRALFDDKELRLMLFNF